MGKWNIMEYIAHILILYIWAYGRLYRFEKCFLRVNATRHYIYFGLVHDREIEMQVLARRYGDSNRILLQDWLPLRKCTNTGANSLSMQRCPWAVVSHTDGMRRNGHCFDG